MRKVVLTALVVVLVGVLVNVLAAPGDAKGAGGRDPRHWSVKAVGGCAGSDGHPQLLLNPIHGATSSGVMRVGEFDHWATPPGWTPAQEAAIQGVGLFQQFTSAQTRRIKGGRESVAAISTTDGTLSCLTVVDRTRHSIGARGPEVGVDLTLGRHPHLYLIDYAAKKGKRYHLLLIVHSAGHKYEVRLVARAARTGVVAWRWDKIPSLRRLTYVNVGVSHGQHPREVTLQRLKHGVRIPGPMPSPEPTPTPTPLTPTPTPTPPPTTSPCLLCL